MKSLEEQFTAIYDTHADAVFRFCFYKTSDREIAEDLVQDVFMRYWNYISKENKVLNEKALLFQIARNLVIDYYRKNKTLSLDTMREEGQDFSNNDHESIVNNSEKNIALKLIDKLDGKYKDIVYMRLVDEMSFEEIGKALKVTANSATVSFHRGSKMLKKLIENL